MKNYITILLILILAVSGKALAQDNNDGKPQQGQKIEIVNSNTLEVDEYHGPNVKVLRGDVQFYHDSASMFCDSALYNSKENNFRAFGRVHMYRLVDASDTVHLWGDSLDYDGATRFARLRDNVVMVKDSMRMVTENIDYDMAQNVANYFDGGTTYSGEDTLISELGYFYPKTNDLVYNKDVVVHNPKYTMYSDTLTHNIRSKISTFLGPTEILGDSNYLYSERGWYNHAKDECQLTKNSYLVSKEHKLVGDTIMYFRKGQYGIGRSRVEIIDTAQNVKLTGNEARYYEVPEHSLLTDSALLTYIGNKDTLYIHADTISSCTDTLFTDSDTTEYRIIKAFRHAKLFRTDIQTMCDSLVFNMNDSIISMHYTPVIWHIDNQITAKTIKLYTIDGGIDMAEMLGDAFVAQQVDTVPRYNQICGTNMVAYLDSNKITEVEVISNSNTIYYTMEDSLATGMNNVSAQDMDIFFENGKMKRIWFYKSPTGTLYPLEGLTKRQTFLNGFVWYGKHRPMKMEDIFKWGEITETAISNESLQAEEEEKRKKEEEEAELE
ncbi:MAG: hypothetical protein MJZ61_01735 [Bacteroidales bacterium]|nr:hypothetical protein [Bacteroidales bacterium]